MRQSSMHQYEDLTEIQCLPPTVFLVLAAVFGAALVALVSVFLLSAFFAAGGEPAFALASLTGPEEPVFSQNCIEPRWVSSSIWAERKDEKEMLTLGALEDARLTTLGKSAVELVGEGGLGHAGEVVVGLNVFLESLTAVDIYESATSTQRDENGM